MKTLTRNEDLYPKAGDMGWLRDLADDLMVKEAAEPLQLEQAKEQNLPALSDPKALPPPKDEAIEVEFKETSSEEPLSPQEEDFPSQADQEMQARVNDISAKIVSVNENLAKIDAIISPARKLWNLFGKIGGGDTVEKLLGKLGKGSEQFRQIAQTITPFLQHLSTLRHSLQGITENKQFFPTIHQQAGVREISLEKIARNINEKDLATLYRQIGAIIGIVIQQGAILKTVFGGLTKDDLVAYPTLQPLKNALLEIKKSYAAFNGASQRLAYASGDQSAVQQLKTVAPEKEQEPTPEVTPEKQVTTDQEVGQEEAPPQVGGAPRGKAPAGGKGRGPGKEVAPTEAPAAEEESVTTDVGQLKSSLKDSVEKFAENILPATKRSEEQATALYTALQGIDSLMDTLYASLTGESAAVESPVATASIQEFDLKKTSMQEFDLKESE